MRRGEREDRGLVATDVEEPGGRRKRRRREQRDADEGALALVPVGQGSRERSGDRCGHEPHDAEDADGLRTPMVVGEDGERDGKGPLGRDRGSISELEPAQVAISRDGPELCEEVPHKPSLRRLILSHQRNKVIRCRSSTPAPSTVAPR